MGNETYVYSHLSREGEDLCSITKETQTAMVNMISKRILYEFDFSKTNRKIKKQKWIFTTRLLTRRC